MSICIKTSALSVNQLLCHAVENPPGPDHHTLSGLQGCWPHLSFVDGNWWMVKKKKGKTKKEETTATAHGTTLLPGWQPGSGGTRCTRTIPWAAVTGLTSPAQTQTAQVTCTMRRWLMGERSGSLGPKEPGPCHCVSTPREGVHACAYRPEGACP